jgi:hypothetical protein
MIPYKVLALMLMDIFAIGAVVWYLRSLPFVTWGRAAVGEQRLLIISGVMVMAMIVTMGFIRENGRYPQLISGQMTVSGQQNVSQPQPTPAGGP